MAFNFKTATHDKLTVEFDRLGKVMDSTQHLQKKELGDLPEALAAGEEVLGLTVGSLENGTWLIALTDRRILFLERGAFFGLKQVSIELGKVNAVVSETGLMFGKVIIHDHGTKRIISGVWKTTAVKFANKVNEILMAREVSRHIPAMSGDDVISKLERLSSLLDKGVLTIKEFEAQKDKILHES